MKIFISTILLVSTIFITSCGKGGGAGSSTVKDVADTVIGNVFSLSAVASSSSLPTCDYNIEGSVYYAESSSEFYKCNSDSWIKMSLLSEPSDTFPVLRVTRTKILYSSSDSTKDSACLSEFGSSYSAATRGDVALHSPSLNQSGYLTVVGDSSYVYKVSWVTDHYGLQTNTGPGGNYGVPCISDSTKARISRSKYSYILTSSQKDSACATEFGSKFKSGNKDDIGFISSPVGQSDYITTADSISEVYRVSWITDRYGVYTLTTPGGTYNLLCIRSI